MSDEKNSDLDQNRKRAGGQFAEVKEIISSSFRTVMSGPAAMQAVIAKNNFTSGQPNTYGIQRKHTSPFLIEFLLILTHCS